MISTTMGGDFGWGPAVLASLVFFALRRCDQLTMLLIIAVGTQTPTDSTRPYTNSSAPPTPADPAAIPDRFTDMLLGYNPSSAIAGQQGPRSTTTRTSTR